MSTEKPPLKVNGRYYPLWSKFVHAKADYIGLKLQDLTEPDAVTKITDIRLEPNGKDSAMFCVDGEDWGCGSDVHHLGVIPGEPGWLTFHGYGGHMWRIESPYAKEQSLSE